MHIIGQTSNDIRGFLDKFRKSKKVVALSFVYKWGLSTKIIIHLIHDKLEKGMDDHDG